MKEIKQLLKITSKLRNRYKRSFTLDGNLVGDIGEVLVAEKYGIELYPPNSHKHDGYERATGRFVQIKSSFDSRSYYPCNHTPNYVICVRIKPDGSLEELFNGKGSFLEKHYIKRRNLSKGNGRYLYTLSGNILQELNNEVPDNDRIQEV